MIFTHDICFIASEAIELKDRAQLEHFIDSYTAQPTAFSSGWDHRGECVAGDVGWVVAFGHDRAQAGQGDQQYQFRMMLACRREEHGWRIAQLYASTPCA